jgi:hypothetical protein
VIHNPDVLHVANIHVLQPYWRAIAQPTRAVRVAHNAHGRTEESGRPAHQEDKNGHHRSRKHNGNANPKLRPAKLLLTRQGFSYPNYFES